MINTIMIFTSQDVKLLNDRTSTKQLNIYGHGVESPAKHDVFEMGIASHELRKNKAP